MNAEDLKTIAELTPLLHKFPIAFIATTSIGYLFTGIIKYIKDHLDRTIEKSDIANKFLQENIEMKLDKIIELTIFINDIKDTVDKMHDQILTIKSRKK